MKKPKIINKKWLVIFIISLILITFSFLDEQKSIAARTIVLALSLDNCGIDFNGNKEANFENGMIKKCIEKGLEVGAWTIDDTDTLDKLAAEGVTLITTDNITK